MAQKRASYMTYGDDDRCSEIRKFIEDAGIRLDVRDLKAQPLTELELNRLLGHIPLTHFLNAAALSYTKAGLDKEMPERCELISLIAKDNSLLRKPIIKTTRLIMVGCDKQKVAQMLQINKDNQYEAPSDLDRIRRAPRKATAATGK